MIYLDNNATTKMDPLVLQEMMPFLTDGYANSASNHSFGVAVSQHIKEARLQIADLIHCEPTEIVFTSGATESINIAIKGIAAQLKDKGNHIITVETEHPAVLDTCEHLAGRGHEITYLKVDNKGLIDLAELEGAIKNTTILISVMFVNNETGVIQPIQEIARIAHEHQILFMSDATQAVGKLPIDVYNWGIDIMAFSAHKFHGPKGVGALFLRNKRPFKVKMPALIHGGGHEMGVRSGTLNVPGIVGMGKAANLARKQMGEGSERIRRYRDRLENTLLAIDHTFVNGDQNLRCHNTTNICFEGADADAIMVGLKEVMVSNGSACTSLSMEPSHVLKAIGLSDQQAFSSLRFSLSRFTTVEEVDRVAQQVAAIVMETQANGMIVTGNETLVELRAADELSVRGFNVCKILGIHTVPELVSYFEVYYSFAMVPNCGIKTNNELTKLYKEIQQLRLVEKTSPADITAHAKNFKEVIEQEFLSLSERSKNGLLGYFNLSELDVEILKEHIFDSSFRLRNIKNIGAKSETEIQQFIIRITDRFLEKASENENEEGSAGLVMKAMIGLNITDGGFITRFQQKKLDLLRFSKIFVEEKLKKKAADLFIFQNHFGFLAEVHTLDSTAKKFGLTRERIRQKKAIVLEKVFNELVVLQKLIPHTNYQEILQLSAPTIIPENVSELHDEITSVGAHYATFAFSALFQEHYFSLTKDDKIKKPVNIDIYEAYNASKKIKGNYLISKGLANKDTLLSLFDFLLEKIVERHSQDILINISAFFFRSFDQPELAALCTIADKEFSLQINQEKGLLRLPRNSIKLTSEFAVEALTKLGKPTHISEIIATIKADYPEFKSNLTSLRNMLAREKTRFIYFGRSSTFGLKEWEQENSSIKGGTIRDIAAEYLELFDFPLHFSSLVQYINKYRNTDYNSVVNNLKISKDKRFSFFKNGHVGLASKEYSKKESANAAPSLLKEVSLEDLLNDIFS